MGYIKLHKQNLFHNLDYFAKVCKEKDKIAAVLKDNAYGHGLEQMVMLANEYGIKHVVVRNLKEAHIVKQYPFETILVLYGIPTTLDTQITIALNSLDDYEKVPNGSKVELKIDTGMHRSGIERGQITQALKLLKQKDLTVFGVFTHFCCSDEDTQDTTLQEKAFLEVVNEIKKEIPYSFRIHCANSAGTHKVDMSQYDIARVGLGIYGYLDLPQESNLKPVLSLHANKISTKKIQKGDHVGYGSKSFIAQKDMVVTNYDIGYGDGLFRANSQKCRKIANGKEILGRVSMDSFSVESVENEVCVFDDANHFAQVHNTITYEILTSLKPNIDRYIRDPSLNKSKECIIPHEK